MFDELKEKYEKAAQENKEPWGSSEEMLAIITKMFELDFLEADKYLAGFDDLPF